MPKTIVENKFDIEDEVELILDNEYRLELQEQVNNEISEELKTRNMVNTFTDMRAYLERNGLDTELFINIDINTINDMISTLTSS